MSIHPGGFHPAYALSCTAGTGPCRVLSRLGVLPRRPVWPPGGTGSPRDRGDLAAAQGLFIGVMVSTAIWALGLILARGVFG